MRHFPRTGRRRPAPRLAAASLAAALALGLTTAPALSVGDPAQQVAGADRLKDKQRKAKKQVRSAQSDLHASSRRMQRASTRLADAKQQLTGAQAALTAAEAKVAVARERDLQMQAALAEAEAELAQARADLEQGRLDVATQQDEVAGVITDIYQQGDPELLAFTALLDSQSPADLTRQAEVRNVIVGRETRAYQEYQATEVLLGVREDQVEDARDEVEAKRRETAEQLARTQEAEAAAEAAKDSVAALVTQRRGARAEAAQAKAADAAALRKAQAQEQRIATMLRRRAERALRARRARQAASAGASRSGGGFLQAPVQGTLSSPYGFRHHPIYGYWGLHDGQDWAAACGTPMVAGADGRVVSSYWSAVYGRRLVIDHGAARGVGLASIFNHATSYTVGVGERVRRGQVIGYVGDTGWSTGCHLHFTVMANGRAVDPRNWL